MYFICKVKNASRQCDSIFCRTNVQNKNRIMYSDLRYNCLQKIPIKYFCIFQNKKVIAFKNQFLVITQKQIEIL